MGLPAGACAQAARVCQQLDTRPVRLVCIYITLYLSTNNNVWRGEFRVGLVRRLKFGFCYFIYKNSTPTTNGRIRRIK